MTRIIIAKQVGEKKPLDCSSSSRLFLGRDRCGGRPGRCSSTVTGVAGGAAGVASPQEGHEGEKEGDLRQLLQSAGPVTLVPLAAECRVCNEEVTIKYRYTL